MSDQLHQRVHAAMQFAALFRERFFRPEHVTAVPLSNQETTTYNAALDLLAFYFKCGSPDEPPAVPADVRPPDPPEPPAAPGDGVPRFPRDPATPSHPSPTPIPTGGAS